MQPSTAKLGLLGLGIYVVSKILMQTASSRAQFAPRGLNAYDAPMVGYDPVAEAIGCACDGSFGDYDDGQLSGFKKHFKKVAQAPLKIVKKVVKAPLKIVKKIPSQVKRDIKNVTKPVVRDFRKATNLVKTDLKNIVKPVVRDFRKAGKLVKTDFRRAGALFGKKKGGSVESAEDGTPLYYDENGLQITKDRYDQLMASYENAQQRYNRSVEAGESPPFSPYGESGDEPGIEISSPHGAPDDSPVWNMEETAALNFEQEQTTGDGSEQVLAQMFNAQNSQFDAQPITGDQFDTWGRAPIGWDGSRDNYAEALLPEGQRESTLDVLAEQSTFDDSIIFPQREPSTPYTGDEMMMAYERPDSEARGEPWEPTPDGDNYMNLEYGGYELPAHDTNYDWNFGVEGLGDLVARPGRHGRMMKPSRMVAINKKNGTVTPLMADERGTIFGRRGGSLIKLGHVNKSGGHQKFGRNMRGDQGLSDVGCLSGWGDMRQKAEKGAKKIASRTTPSGFLYSRLKKNPKLYREYRVGVKTAMPYVMIVGGAVVSVASVGIGSPAGAAMIASGVVSLGAQGYSDTKAREARKMDEKYIEDARIAEAIDSTNVITESYNLEPSNSPAPGEIPSGDWPNQYPGDGVYADFLDLTESLY